MVAKHVSSRAYVWSHVGVILFHVILSCLWITCTYQITHVADPKPWIYTSYGLAALMCIISLLGLIPILKYDTLTITPETP